jgi:hypothetical protein
LSHAAATSCKAKGCAEVSTAGAHPCDATKVAALIDRDAFAKSVARHATGHDDVFKLVELFMSTAAAKLCAWNAGADRYEIIRVRVVEGETRVVLRRTSAGGFGYHEAHLVRIGTEWKLADLFAHNLGALISEEVAGALLVDVSEDPLVGVKIMQINQLDTSGKHVDALAMIDALPAGVRGAKVMQSLRVAISQRVSIEHYLAALEQRSGLFPEMASIPSIQMNVAILRGDPTDALRQIDLLEAGIGGDAFLDSMRAGILLQRNGPGDLDDAAARATRATTAWPREPIVWLTSLGVEVVRRNWARSIQHLDRLVTELDYSLSPDILEQTPIFAELVKSSEYAAWRARQPQ